MRKPAIVGRIMAGSIAGELSSARARRLCSIVDRVYLPDLDWLRSFEPDIQRSEEPTAEILYALGLLSIDSFDGGTASEPGGISYVLNDNARILLRYVHK